MAKTLDELNAELNALKAKKEAIKKLEGESEKYLQIELELAKATAEKAKALKTYNIIASLYEQKIQKAADALKDFQEAAKDAENANKSFDSALKNNIQAITGVTDATLNFPKSLTSCDFCASDRLSPVVLLIDMNTFPYSGVDVTPSDGSKLPSSPPNTETA